MLPLLVFAASNISFVGPSVWTETDPKVTLFYMPLIVFVIRLVRFKSRTTTFLDLELVIASGALIYFSQPHQALGSVPVFATLDLLSSPY